MTEKPKILILNSYQKAWYGRLASSFPAESQVIQLNLNEMNIRNCQGCMSCTWNMDSMNPGHCLLKDDMAKIYPTFLHSDLVILLTEIVFGGFSCPAKKCIDRLLPVLFTAPLKKRGKDIGHIMRYEKRPGLLVVGISNDTADTALDVFNEYVKRLATLWDLPFSASIISSGDDRVQSLVKDKIHSFIRTAL